MENRAQPAILRSRQVQIGLDAKKCVDSEGKYLSSSLESSKAQRHDHQADFIRPTPNL